MNDLWRSSAFFEAADEHRYIGALPTAVGV